MDVHIDKTNEQKTIEFEGIAKDLLDELDINPEEVIVVKNEKVVPLEEELTNEDDVKILTVISGG